MMGPTRVLFLNDTARNGGPGRSLHAILRFVDPDVVHRAVVLPRPGAISALYLDGGPDGRVVDDLHFLRRLVENPFEPWTRPMVRGDFDAPAVVRGVRLVGNVARGAVGVAELAALVRRGGYELLYCNGTNADFLGGLVAMATGVPALWHVRYTHVPRGLRPLHDRLAASAHVARIVCVSRASASLFPHVPGKVRVIANAVDGDAFSPAKVQGQLRRELGLSGGDVVVGSHGRVLRRKGYIEMLDAAPRVLAALPGGEARRVHFVVVGDTPEDFAVDHVDACRAHARGLGLGDRVHFMGFRADVRPYVADFDVAVVPSVYPDPLPRAVLESMALGKPVVAFDVGGVGEMLRGGETGTLVRGGDPPDVAGLAEAIVRYVKDPELRRRHGEAGRARALADFDGPGQARKIEAEIASAVTRGGAAA